MHPCHEYILNVTRRQFLSRGSNAVSSAAAALLDQRRPSALARAGEAALHPHRPCMIRRA